MRVWASGLCLLYQGLRYIEARKIEVPLYLQPVADSFSDLPLKDSLVEMGCGNSKIFLRTSIHAVKRGRSQGTRNMSNAALKY